MEVYIVNGMKGAAPSSSGENFLITGSKGVGKTSLMIGLYTIIKMYGLHVKPIYRRKGILLISIEYAQI